MLKRYMHGASKRLSLLMVVVGFAFAYAAGSLVHAATTEDAPSHSGGPVTERTVVAKGVATAYGRYEVLHSLDAEGRQCLGIQLLDEATAEQTAPLYEGCGGPEALNVGSLNGAERTLLYGWVPAEGARVTVKARGQADRRPELVSAPSHKVFVTAYRRNLRTAKVVVTKADGTSAGQQDVPLSD